MVRLDETVVKASLAIVVKRLNGLWARAARLEAEQRGADKIRFPPMLIDRADDPDVKDVMASETKLFEVRVNGRVGQKAQLRERDHAAERGDHRPDRAGSRPRTRRSSWSKRSWSASASSMTRIWCSCRA